jgi:hypothetical protein
MVTNAREGRARERSSDDDTCVVDKRIECFARE